MRIRILSDLHREFGPTFIPQVEVDLIILAGDIATKLNGLPWIKDFCASTPTAVVCGNHEFYGDKLPRIRERLFEATRDTNIHVLEDDYFTVDGWHVYGCTLWTDLALQGDWRNGESVAGECMNDYKRVRNSARGYRHLSAQDTRMLHLQSVMRMNSFFEEHDPARTIVVTHHAPSALSLSPDHRDKSLSCAYASNLDEFILSHQPPLWVHGHIHHSNDYFIGSTRVISNPQGYPDEPNPDFQPLRCIDVP
jgi:hypothetical protein